MQKSDQDSYPHRHLGSWDPPAWDEPLWIVSLGVTQWARELVQRQPKTLGSSLKAWASQCCGCSSGIALLLCYGICAKQGQQRCKGLRAGAWLALHTHKRLMLLAISARSRTQLVRSHHSQPSARSLPRCCWGPTGPAPSLLGQRGWVRS